MIARSTYHEESDDWNEQFIKLHDQYAFGIMLIWNERYREFVVHFFFFLKNQIKF